MAQDDKERRASEDAEMMDKSAILQGEVNRIADENLLASCVIIGVMAFGKGERAKIAGINGSIYEIIGAMEEFIAEFKSGSMCDFSDAPEEYEGDGDDPEPKKEWG